MTLASDMWETVYHYEEVTYLKFSHRKMTNSDIPVNIFKFYKAMHLSGMNEQYAKNGYDI